MIVPPALPAAAMLNGLKKSGKNFLCLQLDPANMRESDGAPPGQIGQSESAGCGVAG
jgi:hypothetical protein